MCIQQNTEKWDFTPIEVDVLTVQFEVHLNRVQFVLLLLFVVDYLFIYLFSLSGVDSL